MTDEWKAAIIEALMLSGIYRSEHETDPRGALNELLAWHQQVVHDRQQAKIDALMLEYCPQEMTPEQFQNWADHQAPYTGTDCAPR